MAKLKIELEELKDLHDSGVMSTEVWNAAVMEAVRKDREVSSGGTREAAAAAAVGEARVGVGRSGLGIQASAPTARVERGAPPSYDQSVTTDERLPLLNSEPPSTQPSVTRQPIQRSRRQRWTAVLCTSLALTIVRRFYRRTEQVVATHAIFRPLLEDVVRAWMCRQVFWSREQRI